VKTIYRNVTEKERESPRRVEEKTERLKQKTKTWNLTWLKLYSLHNNCNNLKITISSIITTNETNINARYVYTVVKRIFLPYMDGNGIQPSA
jgi:hypothetical protein